MRAFLREPSTPWIVFDQEGRPPSQLAVGEILRGPRRTLLSDYDFSATAAVDFASTHARITEPSSLAVSSDLARAAATGPVAVLTDANDPDIAEIVVAAPMFGLSRRVLGASAAAVALVSMLTVGIFALRGATHDSLDTKTLRSAAVAQPATQAAAVAPIDLSPQPAVAPAAVAPVEVAPAAVAPAPVAATPIVPTPIAQAAVAPAAFAMTVIPPKSGAGGGKYGRLTISGDARAKDVFFDGKRMLGRGQRTFSVMCGMHTISVNVRNDAHDVEIPCNAELVVGK